MRRAMPSPKLLSLIAIPVVLGGIVLCALHGESANPAPDSAAASAPPNPAGAAPQVAIVPAAIDVPSNPATPAPDAPVAAQPPSGEPFELLPLLEQGKLKAEVRSNGREHTVVVLHSNYPETLKTRVPAGQVIEAGRSAVILLRGADAEVAPGKTVSLTLASAALHGTNKVGEDNYKFSYQAIPKLEPFLQYLTEHPELSVASAQTAILALTDNLPLAAVAKFAPTNSPPSKLSTDAFRADTGDIIAALSALQNCRVDLSTVTMALDPQLRIESMIEPLSREAAKRFYRISDEQEWDFWKRELLQGSPGTRHYALYGIARFYSDVALEMLPKWAREPKTHPVYRLSAIQALADTQRPEALPILRQLAVELGPKTDLGKAATLSADYLDKRLTELNKSVPTVPFRGKNGVNGIL